jgi:predicted short-subunit dehydrogenase-like oxidoreductase (DUF2520 family)
MTLHRVLFQYLDDQGHPRFEFTTVLADTAAEAETILAGAHADDIGFAIVQTVPANEFVTGFTEEQAAAAKIEYHARQGDLGARTD